LDASYISKSSIEKNSNLVKRPKDMSLSIDKITAYLKKKSSSLNSHIQKLKLLEDKKISLELSKL